MPPFKIRQLFPFAILYADESLVIESLSQSVTKSAFIMASNTRTNLRRPECHERKVYESLNQRTTSYLEMDVKFSCEVLLWCDSQTSFFNQHNNFLLISGAVCRFSLHQIPTACFNLYLQR